MCVLYKFNYQRGIKKIEKCEALFRSLSMIQVIIRYSLSILLILKHNISYIAIANNKYYIMVSKYCLLFLNLPDNLILVYCQCMFS